MNTTPDFTSDIPLTLAVASFTGTSHSPEKRGAARVAEYASALTSDLAFFREQATEGGTLDLLDEQFARYRAGCKSLYVRWLVAHKSVVSWFIAGPSKFPAARMAKRSRTADNYLSEFADFRQRARRAILKKLRPDLAPIRPNDEDAIERYQKDLAALEYAHERMKIANRTIKKNWKRGVEATALALINEGFSPDQTSKMLTPDGLGGIGFAPYALSLNLKAIARAKANINKVAAYQEKAKGGDIEETHGPCRIVQCFADNRVRIFTPEKPEYSIRAAFKKRGFMWSPTNRAWQRQCTANALNDARELVAAHYPQSDKAAA